MPDISIFMPSVSVWPHWTSVATWFSGHRHHPPDEARDGKACGLCSKEQLQPAAH